MTNSNHLDAKVLDEIDYRETIKLSFALCTYIGELNRIRNPVGTTMREFVYELIRSENTNGRWYVALALFQRIKYNESFRN